ncbi:bifunctional adenosylcobinamide kinase/adenosylcobinamide-phosphate guanylyltransferase [Desulfonema magnum]|uniref:Adenosylcobinamide kinase n=1 Tax=Desulfonema magnum TaxID=45655 RepID=A0A975GMP8_9BACT|nr:bifunctional adenosylcobinamide kinase/adenosylcobinamide-phosphate guanylyltransferase [Desulfonema magnum]QTA86910.1 Cobinamide kinase/cobinamide phosphate guanyltransferasefamily protein [Desulfonema magnum]
MKKITFVIGGCRSGKSRHALELAENISQDKRIFIATCVPYDDEMRQRVSNHQKERGADWSVAEVPILLPEAIIETSQKNKVILVDCLTLWITNLLLEPEASEKIDQYIENLTQSLEKAQCPVILVSNEVGAGIVPENKLARAFRDITGQVNQTVAACSDSVIWMVAGIPVTVKPFHF